MFVMGNNATYMSCDSPLALLMGINPVYVHYHTHTMVCYLHSHYAHYVHTTSMCNRMLEARP